MEKNFTILNVFDAFFVSMKKKITTEYNNQLVPLLNALNNTKDIYNSEDENATYEYIKCKMMFLDLLTMGGFWEDIKAHCVKDLFKVFKQLKDKAAYSPTLAEFLQ